MLSFPSDNQPPLATLCNLFREGSLTPTEHLGTLLQIIDQHEPDLNAWVSVFRETALQQAEQQTVAFSRGEDPGPLAGIPVGVKDIIDIAGRPTGCGFEPFTEPVSTTAPLVKKLEAAGAILLGKTVTTQFACFDPPPTRNPWNRDHTPGGSSSGSAAAVAQGMCPLALATQTGGSVTRPAAYCGIVGFKPGFGTLSTEGIFPVSAHLDQPGFFTRTVEDAALLWNLFTDKVPLDSETAGTELKLGRIHRFFDQHAEPEMLQMMEEIDSLLNKQNIQYTESAANYDFASLLPHHWNIMVYDAAQIHRDRFSTHPEFYLPGMTSLVEAGLNLSKGEYQQSLSAQKTARTETDSLFESADILLTPATLGPAPDPSTTGSPQFNSPWSFLGLPTLTLPVKLSKQGLPLGIQLISRPNHETELLKATRILEQWLQRQEDSD